MNDPHDDQSNPIVELLRDEWLTAGALRLRKDVRAATNIALSRTRQAPHEKEQDR